VSRSFRILIAAVLAVAAVAGYWKLALAPKRQEAAKLEQQLTSAQADLASAQGTIATYRKAQRSYPVNYATDVHLGKAVPADDDSRSLLVQLDAAAKHSGVDFTSIDVGQSGGSTASSTATTATATTGAAALPPGAVSAGSYSELPFSLAFNGDFSGLSNFFGRLERFVTVSKGKVGIDGRLLRIATIDIEPGDGGWPAISAKLGASAYIVPAATGLSSATPAATTPSSGASATVSTANSNLR
jgi:Tfp pilus assembly protein PilO